jgi:hypothetical protein
MKKPDFDDLRPEYDFSAGVRGKYAKQYSEGTNVVVVVLDPDLAEQFPTSEAVNKALRELVDASRTRS